MLLRLINNIYEQNDKNLSAGETSFEKVVKSPNDIKRNISIDIKAVYYLIFKRSG